MAAGGTWDGDWSAGTAARMLAGFAITPPTAVLIALATYDTFWRAGLLPHGGSIDSFDAARALTFAIGILAFLMTCAAVPCVVLLKLHGRLSFARVLLVGAALGNVPFIAIVTTVVAAGLVTGTASGIGRYWDFLFGAVVRLAMGTIVGVGSAAAFWLIGVYSPTRDVSEGRWLD